jgi:hypothetical protein
VQKKAGAQSIPFHADPEFAKVSSAQNNPAVNARHISLGYEPRKFMVPFHQRTQRFSCIVAHRRAGKTVGSLLDTIHRALKKPVGTDARYAFCGPTYSQIKDVVWSYLKEFTRPLPHTSIHEHDLRVTLLNGAMIRLYSLDSMAYDRMRGLYLDGCTIDEYADCDPRALGEVIRPALSDRRGWLSLIGTAKGRDAFYRVWREARKNPQDWYTARLRASETGVIPPDELEQMRRMMGPNEYARELECSFEVEGVDQLVPGYLIETAHTRTAPRDPEQPTIFGLDVARYGDDRTVLVVREGNRLVDGRVWKNIDTMECANHVQALAATYRPRMICIDGVGVGGGVIDRLRHLGHTNVEDVNLGKLARDQRKFADLRAECYAKLVDWLKERGCFHENFPLTSDIEEDLTSLLYEIDHRGRMKVQSKDSLKKKGMPSPDVADAAVLTFAVDFPTYDVARLIGREKHYGYAAPVAEPEW